MHAWEAVQVTLDHIEEHLADELQVEELARMAGLSPFYYQRLFSRLVRRPLREYIRLRRLARATGLLADGDGRILDVALETGFGSHEGFTRAFKEAYGMTPEHFRRQPMTLNHFNKPDLLLQYVMVDEGVPLISEGLVLEYNRKTLDAPVRFMGVWGYVAIQGQMPMGETTGVGEPGLVWDRFHREKLALPRLAGGRELGVSYMGDAPKGCFTYFAGAEVAAGATDAHFETWELPAGAYIVCGFEAEDFDQLVTVAIYKAANFTGRWLQQHGITQEAYAPELYYDNTPESAYMELWIPCGA